MKDYLRFLKFLKPHLWVLGAAIFCMVISSAMGGVSLGMIIPMVDTILAGKALTLPSSHPLPAFLTAVVEKINSMPRVSLLNWLILVVAGLFLVKEVFLFFQTYFMNKLGQSVLRDVRLAVYNKLLEFSRDFYSDIKTGEIVSRITFDTGVIVNSITEGLTDLLWQPIQVVIYISVLIGIKVYFNIPWALTLVTVFVFPLLSYPVIRIGKRLRKFSTAKQESMSGINSVLFETVYGIDIIKTFGAERHQRQKFVNYNHMYFKMIMKSVKRMAVISPLGEFVGILCMSIVLWVGGRAVVEGTISAGAFVAFLAALLSLIKPLKRLSRLYAINQQAMAAIVRIFKILDTEPAIKDSPSAIELSSFNDSIEFKGVYFAYRKLDFALKDVNITLSKGKVLAIVGLSGAGKTTFVNLLPRFYDPQKGAVLIDGRDIREFKLDSLRRNIGIVTQETILFNDTVRNNIALGVPGAVMEDIERVAKAANAHDFIMSMPQGYDTFIGDRGINISGGEKQRIAIARALFKDPPILILDEATSQLDSQSEKLVQEAIDRLMQNRTVFVIAHRLSTVEHADRIVVFEKGRIVESGTHRELIEINGVYKRLYELQFKKPV